MQRYKIAAIVPTFNRKRLLIDCLQSLCSQTYKPKTIFVCNNKSTDGTIEYLQEQGYFNTLINGVEIKYLEMPINGGGAMGFSIGMKTAYEDGVYDAFWMMDDDGLPKEDCLEYLVSYLNVYDYISPIVYSRSNPTELVSPLNGSTNPEQICKVYGNGDFIKGYCNPFNGSLFSKNLVDYVGFPQKELFIYGDEMNYHLRCIMHGFEPITIPCAIHFHPPFDTKGTTKFGVVNFKPIKVAMYCQWRNNIYNKKIRFRKEPIKTVVKILNYFIMHNFFFIIKQPSFKWLLMFNKAFFAGLFSVWGGQYKYLK